MIKFTREKTQIVETATELAACQARALGLIEKRMAANAH